MPNKQSYAYKESDTVKYNIETELCCVIFTLGKEFFKRVLYYGMQALKITTL